MGFLNYKEDVIDFQLTQHGKRLLSTGELFPVYYSFHDDDILYDPLYAGVSQSQDSIEDRIKWDSLQCNSAYNYEGVDKPTTKNNSTDKNSEQYFVYALGDSSPGDGYLPSINVSFLNGSIKDSVLFLSSSYYPWIRIPQLNSEIYYDVSVGDANSEGIGSSDRKYFDNGTYIAVDKEYVVLEITEENVDYEDYNFEVEVFEVKDDAQFESKEDLEQLEYNTQNEGDLYYREKKNAFRNYVDEGKVEYYFEILADTEIDDSIMCELRTKNKSFTIPDNVSCPETKKIGTAYPDTGNETEEDEC